MNKNPIPLTALAVLLAAPSLAQEQSGATNNIHALDEVVVTDTRIPQPQDSVTQNVALVYAEDMDSRSATKRNLTELFKYEGGQFVNPLSRNDANWGSYGGLGPKYNSYLLDGLPVDSFVDTMSLDPWAFDRAELHKGPASVLYANYLTMDFAGNQAPLAGTTNLILKDRIDESGSRIMAGYGSWNTYNAKLYHQGSKDNLHYFFGAGHEDADYTNYGTTPSWLNMLDDPEYQKTKVYGKVSYFFSPASRVSLFAHHTSHDGDAGRLHRDYSHNYDTVNLDWLHQFNEDISLQVKAGYRGYDRNWSNDHYPDSLALRDRGGVEQKIFPFFSVAMP
ncbi:MAG: hypothetical protein D3904_02730 [Candidatus Electrothrix sp. EH2]|nr:hypothetical protein [Candidatus Electrothrix sp. EH2]